MHINAMTQQPNGENGSNSNLYMRLQQSQTIRANIQNISQMLNTGLSPEALDLCVSCSKRVSTRKPCRSGDTDSARNGSTRNGQPVNSQSSRKGAFFPLIVMQIVE
ncbi:AAEL011054-PA [Aedes aegypti]|uniref:AAEL011054-PA n=1 Tax=Aedes aegypti TaxID=7159 RepID=Q16R77_AEDAE|nr:AAEL011054-PA [Aedes aegypti]